MLCNALLNTEQTILFTETYDCDNDKAHKLVLYDVPAGRVIRLYDNTDGSDGEVSRKEDWAEIVVKRDVEEKRISTFEESFEDEDVRVIYHRNDNLDGELSRVEIDSTPSGPIIDFYEGNNATQNLVCSLSAATDRTVKFTDDNSYCANDEARSLVLYDVPAGRIIRLYDNTDGNDGQGNRKEAWAEIVVKQAVKKKVIPTFENSFEDDDVRVTYHRNDNLNGKVSRVEIDSAPAGPIIDLYEGNNAKQNLVCSLSAATDRTVNLHDNSYCDHDKARSLILYDVAAGTTIRLYDAQDGSREDDWLEIFVKRSIKQKRIDTFERRFEDDDLLVIYHEVDNLDEKVSRLEIDVCGYFTGIHEEDCEVLVNLYRSTGGDNWKNKNGWLTTNTPCEWYGVTCSDERVVGLNLPGNNLVGTLPDDTNAKFSDLTELQGISLYRNPGLVGNLSVLEGMPQLHQVNLYLNGHTGPLPDLSASASTLNSMWFASNRHTGQIPDLSIFPNLRSVHLGNNDFTGFEGNWITNVGTLINLEFFVLAANPRLTGSLPMNMTNLTKLENLALQKTQIAALMVGIHPMTRIYLCSGCRESKFSGEVIGAKFLKGEPL